ncbi:MAG: hypothetical protein WAO08_29175 [Hyphomicrobiaceae bacterium]
MIKAKRSGHATFETPDRDKTIAYFTGVSGLVRNEGEGSPLPGKQDRTISLEQRRTRDLAMFNLAIDSKSRGCDFVALRVDDVAQRLCD